MLTSSGFCRCKTGLYYVGKKIAKLLEGGVDSCKTYHPIVRNFYLIEQSIIDKAIMVGFVVVTLVVKLFN